jgi:hypothetical protein
MRFVAHEQEALENAKAEQDANHHRHNELHIAMPDVILAELEAGRLHYWQQHWREPM